MTTKFNLLYTNADYLTKMTPLVAARLEKFVQRLLGVAQYEYSDGRYPGFSSEIISCHYPLRDDHIEHINRVIVGHLMLRCNQLTYFSNRLNPTLSKDERSNYDDNLQTLGKIFRGEIDLSDDRPEHLKQQLVFALAILHDVGKTAFLNDAGHEERAGKLVARVLTALKQSLYIDDKDVLLGKILIENHTMLGTLVQGERSAFEVSAWLKRTTGLIYSEEMYLSYLLLLNCMDLAGYRYMPIILDHYWTERYIRFSTRSIIKNYAQNPIEFAEYRLCELARSNISDFGDTPQKKFFHNATKDKLGELPLAVQQKIGRMWIRDALYLIIDINKCGIEYAGWDNNYAELYINFFKALAEIALHNQVNTVAYRQGDNPNPRTADPKRIKMLLEKLKKNNNIAVRDSFKKKRGTVEFTINEDGLLVGVL